ncbi:MULTISPECIES: Z-ring formation inhibitor MciZ [Thermoactinomyces]|uniref:Z-ring formation inhibitor MciZ n=1 Tax=Thermoactinomyces daqus TaxID=1329516 RepID=A0A7W1XA56_9BACL|nr:MULTISPECIES: Z-ring formation inhibitor MciZ [Thermoactinomyces]MBA4542856.1 Z-ring formation inhibitor MciZ [Thermoactinomyces daqus]MBH8596704.1 Z-ring formation inhibitor MciZ [Thermoactinomyces sp. CICC 10523]MBH8603466.1 Z-ring formation inhibitor MciZ [Thermoactinomyces sp. CICC 10522]MBH8606631.1 Z-ring formation inhibitor MciZ [Thermoactinomyces sp. CICC 10521]
MKKRWDERSVWISGKAWQIRLYLHHLAQSNLTVKQYIRKRSAVFHYNRNR